jgi:hypothetical protein
MPPAKIKLIESYDINSSYHSRTNPPGKEDKAVQTIEHQP